MHIPLNQSQRENRDLYQSQRESQSQINTMHLLSLSQYLRASVETFSVIFGFGVDKFEGFCLEGVPLAP